MAEGSRPVLRFLAGKIYKLLLTKKSAYVNATKNVQYKVLNLQNNVSNKFNTMVKQMNNYTIVQDVNATSLQPSPALPKRLINYWQWYQKLVGLDTVEIAKQQVIVVQNDLFKCQNQRRHFTQQISLINGKLKEIYSELIQTKRDNPKYVQLTILENKSLQEHSKITEQLEILEQQEHDYFAQLATSIKEYHDCQIMITQKYKYLSILASVFFGIISLGASIFYNNRRLRDLKDTIYQGEKSMESILKNEFLKMFNYYKNEKSTYFNNVMNNKSDNVGTLDKKQITYIVTLGIVTHILLQAFKN